jgi:hypothetical protein
MEQFHFIVLSVATVFLILIFIFVAIMVNQKSNKAAFPPVGLTENPCPNYWTKTGEDDNYTCVSQGSKNVGTLVSETVPLNSTTSIVYKTDSTASANYVLNVNAMNSLKSGNSLLCKIKNYANLKNIVWDGVTTSTACK